MVQAYIMDGYLLENIAYFQYLATNSSDDSFIVTIIIAISDIIMKLEAVNCKH